MALLAAQLHVFYHILGHTVEIIPRFRLSTSYTFYLVKLQILLQISSLALSMKTRRPSSHGATETGKTCDGQRYMFLYRTLLQRCNSKALSNCWYEVLDIKMKALPQSLRGEFFGLIKATYPPRHPATRRASCGGYDQHNWSSTGDIFLFSVQYGGF